MFNIWVLYLKYRRLFIFSDHITCFIHDILQKLNDEENIESVTYLLILLHSQLHISHWAVVSPIAAYLRIHYGVDSWASAIASKTSIIHKSSIDWRNRNWSYHASRGRASSTAEVLNSNYQICYITKANTRATNCLFDKTNNYLEYTLSPILE